MASHKACREWEQTPVATAEGDKWVEPPLAFCYFSLLWIKYIFLFLDLERNLCTFSVKVVQWLCRKPSDVTIGVSPKTYWIIIRNLLKVSFLNPHLQIEVGSGSRKRERGVIKQLQCAKLVLQVLKFSHKKEFLLRDPRAIAFSVIGPRFHISIFLT